MIESGWVIHILKLIVTEPSVVPDCFNSINNVNNVNIVNIFKIVNNVNIVNIVNNINMSTIPTMSVAAALPTILKGSPFQIDVTFMWA